MAGAIENKAISALVEVEVEVEIEAELGNIIYKIARTNSYNALHLLE